MRGIRRHDASSAVLPLLCTKSPYSLHVGRQDRGRNVPEYISQMPRPEAALIVAGFGRLWRSSSSLRVVWKPEKFGEHAPASGHRQ
jgi:hypothetical protein